MCVCMQVKCVKLECVSRRTHPMIFFLIREYNTVILRVCLSHTPQLLNVFHDVSRSFTFTSLLLNIPNILCWINCGNICSMLNVSFATLWFFLLVGKFTIQSENVFIVSLFLRILSFFPFI